MYFLTSRTLGWLLCAGSLALGQQYTISTVAGGAPPATPATAASTSIGQPQHVAVDSASNLYFTSSNAVFKVDSSGTLTLIAGNSKPGYSGDGGPAVKAQFNRPQGIALDPSGNVYVADSGNHVVRLISGGIITTIAGNGTPGYSGNAGAAIGAQLNLPQGVAIDGNGNLYIADTGNSAIRQVSQAGIIVAFAGNGSPGFSGDTSTATLAQINYPGDLVVDSKNNVYIADTGNSVIRKVTTDGNINTVAGNELLGFAGDGGNALGASLFAPHSLAVDSSGDIYISEYADSRIRKVSASNGNISTIAGTGIFGFSGDGNSAINAQMANPWGVCLDSGGNLYVADLWNYRVRKISASGTMSTVAGNGTVNYSGDGGQAIQAQLNGPQAVAVDAGGDVFIADTKNQRVRKVSAAGVITTFAGTGIAGSTGDGGPAANAQLNSPAGVAVDAAGNVYIADSGNDKIRQVSPSGVIATFAGSGTAGSSGDGGPASQAELNDPRGLAIDGSNSLYIADLDNSRVRKISPDGTITTVAGSGAPGYSGDGGQATAAQISGPNAVALDTLGNLYIADFSADTVRMVSPKGIITTIAGNGGTGYSGDGGLAANSQIAAPHGVAVDAAGNVYIAESSTRVLKIAGDGTISTIAGDGVQGYSGDGGAATSAQINGPSGIALDTAGDLYIADTNNNAIRMLRPTTYGVVVSAVTNSASSMAGAVAPGEVVAIYGSGLGPAQVTPYQTGSNGLATLSLAGTRVLMNQEPVPIFYTSASAVAAIVPYSATAGSQLQVVVEYLNQTSSPMTVTVAAAAPGLYTSNSSGTGQAAAINQNGTVHGLKNPAHAGDTITLFGTGGGQTSPAGIDGSIASTPAPQQALPVTATIGGQTVPATAGGVPGDVSGIMQIKVQIPSGIAAGAIVPITIQVGGVSSQTGVTIAVQ